jgi:hypothetical protein
MEKSADDQILPHPRISSWILSSPECRVAAPVESDYHADERALASSPPAEIGSGERIDFSCRFTLEFPAPYPTDSGMSMWSMIN